MKKHYYFDLLINICNKKHLSIEEIYSEILKVYPKAWKSTIYRNVEELSVEGRLKKVKWLWKKTYFEKNIGNHIHLVDKNTWEIFDIEENIEFKNIPDNFKISDVDIRILWEFV